MDDVKEDWPWPNFTRAEMSCRGTGDCHMDPDFMDMLQRLREILSFPLIVSSAYRSPEYNRQVSPKTGLTGPHTTGRAVDIKIYGRRAFTLEKEAYNLSYPFFTGFGRKQHGPIGGRFIHLDSLANGPGCPRPWVWSYK